MISFFKNARFYLILFLLIAIVVGILTATDLLSSDSATQVLSTSAIVLGILVIGSGFISMLNNNKNSGE